MTLGGSRKTGLGKMPRFQNDSKIYNPPQSHKFTRFLASFFGIRGLQCTRYVHIYIYILLKDTEGSAYKPLLRRSEVIDADP